MKNRYSTFLSLGLATVAMLGVTLIPVDGQLLGNKGGKAKIRYTKGGGPVDRIGTVEIDQPDFGGPGVWGVPYITNMSQYITDHDEVPFTELGREKMEARRGRSTRGTLP